MISGRETMFDTGKRACAMKSVTFSLMVCNGHYVPLVFMPGKSESVYHSMCSAIRSLCERQNLTLEPTTVHIDYEVAMHTVLKNVQCTFEIP